MIKARLRIDVLLGHTLKPGCFCVWQNMIYTVTAGGTLWVDVEPFDPTVCMQEYTARYTAQLQAAGDAGDLEAVERLISTAQAELDNLYAALQNRQAIKTFTHCRIIKGRLCGG